MSGPGNKGPAVVGLILGGMLRTGAAGRRHPKVRMRVESSGRRPLARQCRRSSAGHGGAGEDRLKGG
jgi:hypothetical protein